MKKVTMAILVIILMLGVFSPARADAVRSTYTTCPNDNYLTVTWLWNPFGIGSKIHLFNNVYAAPHLEYLRSDTDLTLQLGAVYMIPRKVLIFNFYVGSGVEFSRNSGYQYPYITIGTNFWFLFTEVIHPFESHAEPKFRLGISVRF